MAIPWLAVLKSVPWTEVIGNAPKVADGAKKLWRGVSGKAPAQAAPKAAPPPGVAPETQAIAELRKQVDGLAAATADLHSQMLASSELIKALAEQNGQLIAGIEANRVRLRWLTGALVAVGAAALAALLW